MLPAKKGIAGLVAATRVHQNQSSRPIDLRAVSAFFTGALAYADTVMIAVGTTDSATLASIQQTAQAAEQAASRAPGTVLVLQVTPWGQFTPALNALLCAAASAGAPLILFQSLETAATPALVSALEAELDPAQDLVVGAALPGHDFSPGEHEITGTTTPWNTLALWSVPQLARLGFLTVSDGAVAGVAAGVEEVAAISLLQQLRHSGGSGGGGSATRECRAKLLCLEGATWEAEWEDDARRSWHASKMASKRQRAAAQMAALCARPGRVLHIDRRLGGGGSGGGNGSGGSHGGSGGSHGGSGGDSGGGGGGSGGGD
ncbi:hypothetical protein JKP88DRAFT_312468 [Tribonema minus]|uniref:Uncharacterized protein n=1 Tax=Tribonema minus TaxID=303371 RepID=A0A835Z311_9STRA|nr:hypothetical protein JKP88DRAFT_312468 [Tribonema minus]